MVKLWPRDGRDCSVQYAHHALRDQWDGCVHPALVSADGIRKWREVEASP